jgi:hypothetical protein
MEGREAEEGIEGIYTDYRRSAFQLLCSLAKSHIATKKFIEGVPSNMGGSIPE